MERSVKEILEEAVQRFCNGEKLPDDNIMVGTVSSAITLAGLKQGDEIELARFSLSHPQISWTVMLQVGSGDVVRIVLSEVFARDMARLRVQGTIHFARHDEDMEDNADDNDEDLAGASNASTCSSTTDADHPLRRRRKPVVVVTDQPATIASVHLSAVTQVSVLMASFYVQDEHRDDDPEGQRQRGAENECGELRLRMLTGLSTDLSRLLATQESADVLLQVGELPVKAHKAVLVARSEMFRDMLAQDDDDHPDGDKELSSSLQALRIADAPHAAFFKVMQYMYTADVSAVAGDEMDVLVLATRFGLAELADECCRRLLAALEEDEDLALDLLAFAEQHGVAALKERALHVAVQHLSEVTATARWRDLKQRTPSLAADLLETAARVLVPRTTC